MKDMPDPLLHFAKAETTEHPLGNVEFELSEDQVAAAEWARRHLYVIPGMRLERLEVLRDISDRLRPLTARTMREFKPHVRAAVGPNAHPAFAAAVITAFDWPDKSFPRDHFLNRHGVVGHLPDYGLWREKDASAPRGRAAAPPRGPPSCGAGSGGTGRC
jgi:hypothetical protein